MNPFLWDIDYELGSIIVLGIVLVFTLKRKQLETRQAKMFTELVLVFWLTLFFDNTSALCLSFTGTIPKVVNHIVTIIYYCLACWLPMFFYLYVLQVAHKTGPFYDKLKKVIFIPSIALIILSLSSPFTGLIYKFVDMPDGTYKYIAGPCWSLVFYNSLLYFVLMMVSSLYRAKRLRRIRQIVIVSFAVITMALTFTQMLILKEYLLTYLSGGILGVFLYLTLENPDAYIDKFTGLLNYEGFDILAMDRFERKKPFYAYAIEVKNIDEIGRIFDKSAEEKYRAQIAKILKEDFYVDLLKPCMLSDDFFIVISDKVFYEEKLKTLITTLKGIKFQGRKVEVDIASCIIDVEKYASSVEQLVAIARYGVAYSHTSGKEIVEFDEEKLKAFERQEKIANIVRHVDTNNAVQVYYQPICDSESGKIVAAEALCRLHDPELGTIMPYEFIDLAEKNASIIQLGRQVFEKVCKFISVNDISKYGMKYISVNFSPIQCMQADIATEVNKSIRDNHVDPSLITIEITESVQLGSFEHASRMMNRIKLNGIRFSLDDYGTGFSNLSYIGQMNFDIVKLDRSLLLAYFEQGVELLPNTIRMFNELNLQMVAEGVETKEQMEALKEMGCKSLQGYYFAKPLPEKDFIEYMRTHSTQIVEL